jgi:GYF domain 2
VAGREPIWHVIIGGRQIGPLTEDQVLGYLGDGTLAADDLLWCPDFSDWKRACEIGDSRPLPGREVISVSQANAFWDNLAIATEDFAKPTYAPPLAWMRTRVFADDRLSSTRELISISHANAFWDNLAIATEDFAKPAEESPPAWSLWASANAGMIVGAFLLFFQVGRGQGFELASYAHTASVGSLGALIGLILGMPLLFVLLALARNLVKRPRPTASANALRHGLVFAALLFCMVGVLRTYGEFFFSSNEIINGEARRSFVAGAYGTCLRKWYEGGKDVSGPEVDKYCICASQKLAARTTYQQLGSLRDAGAPGNLRQRIEAVSDSCR